MLVFTHQLGQFCQGLLTITQYGHIYLHVLVDFRRVNVHVDNLGLLGVCIQVACHTVVETHTYGNQHITFVGLDIRAEVAVHPQHPLVQRMVGRNGRKSKQCTSARNVRFFQESNQFCLRITQFHSLTNQDKRLLGGIDQIGSMLEFHPVGIRNRVIATDKVKVNRFIIHHFHLCVLGKVKHHRTRTTALGDIESTSHRPSHIFRPTDLIAPFTDRLGYTHQIDFLKRIRTQERSSHLSRNHHNRRTVYHGIRHTRNRIGCPGATGYQAHTHLTRYTGKALSRMGSTLFVANQNVVQRITMSI